MKDFIDFKIVEKFTSNDVTREALTAPYSTGKEIVATDGRRMIVWRDAPEFPVGYVAIVKGQAHPSPRPHLTFPAWEQVVPRIEGAEKITVTIPKWFGRLRVTGKMADRVPAMFDVGAKCHVAFDACLLAPLAEERVDMYLTGVLDAALIVPAGTEPTEAPWMMVLMPHRSDAAECVKIPAGK